jgi:4-aminobutyrate aminotransferase/(S)-3-amino-2-methylpropionate transaminase
MNNQSPGAPNFVAIGFQGGSHGKFMTSLSASSYNQQERNGLSTHNWPIAPFPNIKYPYEDFYNENIKEENRCVGEVEKIIKSSKAGSVAALIIEPIQIDAGIRYASPLFYRQLIDLCYDNNIAFICDETKTSGWVSGRPFTHYNWNSERTPHLVTFGGRMQISGVYYHHSFRPRVGGVIASTWNGDPVKILLFNRLHDLVHNQDWIDAHCPMFSQSVKSELFHVQRLVKFKISNIRGVGKIFAFDVNHRMLRDEIVSSARTMGFKVMPLNDTTIGFTPSLLFAEFHFTHFKNFLANFTPTTLYFG